MDLNNPVSPIYFAFEIGHRLFRLIVLIPNEDHDCENDQRNNPANHHSCPRFMPTAVRTIASRIASFLHSGQVERATVQFVSEMKALCQEPLWVSPSQAVHMML
jgi:hypothetical protein